MTRATAFAFPSPVEAKDVITPKTHASLAGCTARSTFYFWIQIGLLNASRTKRIKLPSMKLNGSRITTPSAHEWWLDQLQT